MNFIEEIEYAVTYTPSLGNYELTEYYVADSITEAITMYMERNEDCNIKEVRKMHTVVRQSTKTITIEV